MKRFLESKWFDFFIICVRISMIRLFLSYGWTKLTENQFGVSPEVLLTPLKDLSLFQVGWYLFDHQPFKFIIGISQIICALLLVFNRTVIIGTLMFIVITFNILIIDETIMPDVMRIPFRHRLLTYIALAFVILYHYRERFLPAIKIILSKYQQKIKVKFWWFLLIPVGLILVELISVFVSIIIKFITDYNSAVSSVSEMFNFLLDKIK